MKIIVCLLLTVLCHFAFSQSQSGTELRQYAFEFDKDSQYEKALDLYNQAANRFLTERDSSLYFKTQLDIARTLMRLQHLDEALIKAETALDEYGTRLSSKEKVRGFKIMAEIYQWRKDFGAALQHYDKALVVLDNDNSIEAKRTKANLYVLKGKSSKQSRQFDQAAKSYKSALEILYTLPLSQVESDICNNSIRLSRLLRFGGAKLESIKVLIKAEQVLSEYNELSGITLAKLYGAMGDAYDFTFGIEKSTDYYLKAKNVLDKLPTNLDKIGNLYNLAFNLASMRDFENATSYVKEGVEFAKKLLGETSPWVVSGQYTLSIIYLESGLTELAEQAALLGLVLCKRGNILNTATGSQVLTILGKIREEQGDFRSAISYLKQSMEVLDSLRTHEMYYHASIYNALGDNYLALEQTHLALKNYQRSLIANTPEFNEGDILLSPTTSIYYKEDWGFSALVGKALALERMFDEDADQNFLMAALNTAKTADNLIFKAKQLSTSLDDQLSSQTEIVTINRTAIRVSYELYQLTQDNKYLEDAFHFSEAVKSNLILTSLNEAVELENINVPISIIRKNDNLQQDIAYYEQELFKAKKDNDTTALQHFSILLSKHRLKSDSLKRHINQLHPTFFQAKFSNEFATLSSVQQSLGRDQTVLSFSVGDSSIYIFEVSNDQVQLHRKPFKKALVNQVSAIRSMIESPVFSEESAHAYKVLSDSIRQNLLPETLFSSKNKRLTIIPDDFISLVPFEALMIPKMEQKPRFSSLDYLINTYQINYANSATLFLRQKEGRAGLTKAKVVAFAPVFQQESVDLLVEKDSSRAGLKALAWTEHEVGQISQHFGTTVLLGDAANESAFRASTKDYSVIHVASHSLLNKENALYSKLVFSPFKTDSINDGYLNTQELYAMKIPAEMVVLSACNTASGDIASGEGVLSLANGFFYAGSKSLVMSLWTANDQSTANIIGGFYGNLAQGQTKSEALRNAKLNFLSNADDIRSHPYYWAHLVINGNDRPIKASSNLVFYILAFVCVLAIGFAIRNKKKRA